MEERVIAGRYRLQSRLGRGGMAEVWLAQDAELERPVAVKLLGPTADRARFEREARAAAALGHPNICLIYDFGEAEGRPFMVLEHLGGGTLEDRLEPGQPLPEAEVRRVAIEVASGLAHAHERGVVHRDLKPANILFDEAGRAKIGDFGIAHLGGEGTLTEAGTLLGTAAYLSPEQASGLQATPASDVYSFGVILYRLLTGRPPFESTSALELVRSHREDPAPDVLSVRPDAPSALAAAAMAALAKDPAARPADGAELLAALEGEGRTEALQQDDRTVVIPFRERHEERPKLRLRPLVLLLLVAPLAAAGLGVAFVVTQPEADPPSVSTSAPPSTEPPATTADTEPATSATTFEATTSAPTSTTGAGTTAPTTTAPPEEEETTAATTTDDVLPTLPTRTEPTTAPTTTAAPTTSPPPSTDPPPTTTAPPATTTAPPATTTEPPPTTTEPPPTTTAIE